jgi:hypothetical protein
MSASMTNAAISGIAGATSSAKVSKKPAIDAGWILAEPAALSQSGLRKL